MSNAPYAEQAKQVDAVATDAKRVNTRAVPGRCRYSGLTIVSCKRSDLCDCHDYPLVDVALATNSRPPGAC